MNKTLSRTLFFLLCLTLSLLAACSNELSGIRGPEATVIFDYADNSSSPEVRLCVFTETSGNVRRLEKFCLKSLKENFVWETKDFIQVQNGNKLYAGYTNFVVPQGFYIPKGEYEINYIEADQKEYSIEVLVNYEEKLYESNAENFQSLCNNLTFNKKIAIYDINQALIYFGDIKNDLTTNEKILKKYKSADSFRKVYCVQDNTFYCLLPVEKI
ncbi:MAG: hypothetical protein K6D95_10835 [Treponema sp.]|nr:hypothetical protein [Treponema sp.]